MPAKYYVAKPEPVETMPDGREVCNLRMAAGKKEYLRRLGVMIIRQLGRCAICRLISSVLQFDHAFGRGHGGGQRDDRVWDADGNPMNAALCPHCNSLKGSKRYEWRDGIYQPVVAERMQA